MHLTRSEMLIGKKLEDAGLTDTTTYKILVSHGYKRVIELGNPAEYIRWECVLDTLIEQIEREGLADLLQEA